MLKINPTERPTCVEILERLNDQRPELDNDNYMETDHYEPIDQEDDPMLCTINLPYDLKLLDTRLPRSNYGKPTKDKSFVTIKQRHSSAKPMQNDPEGASAAIAKSRSL